MSRVFVAQETALGRKVVLKVLPPELGAGLNIDRFRREIQLAASLQHPHIVPLHAAGQADGLLYFSMPLVEGEALRAKLAREGEQPISETVRTLRDIVDALAYAHGRGVVHRDIKPDNVLISHHHALVTDFGVAKALSESTGRSTFTSAGVALGTPAYMAPEQASADPHTDHRADIYAVGAVAYEMLTGRPPFTGATAQAVLAAHVTKAVEPIGELRPSVPPGLQALVMRCLEKKPADRWQTAEELLHQLESMATPSGGMAPTASVPAVRRRRRWAIAASALLGVAVAGAGAVLWSRSDPRPRPVLSQNVVAVLPFRVSGADPQLAYLGEGMVDLLATQLTGEGGPRAVDSRAALSAWHRAGGGAPDADPDVGLRAARELGAGTIVEGSVVGTPSRLVLAAAIRDAESGATRGQAKLEGSADSLPALVDRLTGQLLLESAGRRDRALATLTPLPALRAYLDGQASRRRGDYDSAASRFSRALDIDSTFAIAAMALQLVSGWGYAGSPVADPERGVRLAWRYRDHLSPLERALLRANIGPAYPETSPLADYIAAAEDAVRMAPEHPEAWLWMGEWLFHYGLATSVPDWRERATAALQRSIALDPGAADPHVHLIQLLLASGDSAELRRVGTAFLSRDSSFELADYFRWQIALGTRDSAELAMVRGRFDRMSDRSLDYIAAQSIMDGLPLRDARRASDIRMTRPTTKAQRAQVAGVRYEILMVAGRPGEAVSAQRIAEANGEDPLYSADKLLYRALYLGGDTAGLASTLEAWARSAGAPPAPAVEERTKQLSTGCGLAEWHLAAGRSAEARPFIDRVRTALARGDSAALPHRACATLLGAWSAAIEGEPGAGETLRLLDSLMRRGEITNGEVLHANLIAARAFERHGDFTGALAAVRRRIHHLSWGLFIGPSLREEARLAATTGDREGAIRALRHWLALHDHPEDVVRSQVDAVKAELAKLVGEPQDR